MYDKNLTFTKDSVTISLVLTELEKNVWNVAFYAVALSAVLLLHEKPSLEADDILLLLNEFVMSKI